MHRQFLKETYERYVGELVRYLRHLRPLRSQEEADDIAQTAFLRLAALRNPDEVENPRAFLYATARNLVVDRARRRAYVERVGESIIAVHMADPEERSPERIVLGVEQLRIVERAIQRLPAKRREVFILSRIDHLSYDQIAKRTGLSVMAVKQHVIRALADCRRALSQEPL